jgi:hypothetical protein
MTADWDRFVESVQGGRDWANSVDTTALLKLQGDELERATQTLLSRLALGSARFSRALGLLKDPRVLQALEAHLPQAEGADRIATASSLLRLGSPQHRAVIQVIAGGLNQPDERVANEALKAAEVAGPAIVPALLATAVTDPRPHMRVGAITAALFVMGVIGSVMTNDHRTEIVGLAVGQPDVRRDCFERLCQLMNVDLTTYPGPRP